MVFRNTRQEGVSSIHIAIIILVLQTSFYRWMFLLRLASATRIKFQPALRGHRRNKDRSFLQLNRPSLVLQYLKQFLKRFWCCTQGSNHYWDNSHKHVPPFVWFSRKPLIFLDLLFVQLNPAIVLDNETYKCSVNFPFLNQSEAGMSCLYHMVYSNFFVGHWNNFFYNLPLDFLSNEVLVPVLLTFIPSMYSFFLPSASLNWSLESFYLGLEFVLIAFSCTANATDSISLYIFPFSNQSHFYSLTSLPIWLTTCSYSTFPFWLLYLFFTSLKFLLSSFSKA